MVRLFPGRETSSPSGPDFGRELTTTSNGLVDAAACGRPEPTINRMDAGRRGSPTPGRSSLFPRPRTWRPDSWTLRLANRTSAAPRRNRLEHEPLTPARSHDPVPSVATYLAFISALIAYQIGPGPDTMLIVGRG